jgi:branched-chain amino acid transport system substrate-binding protein
MRILAVLIAVALTLGALSAHAASDRDIVIGQVADATGDNAEISRDYVAGERVYFDFVNSTGGVAGRRISLVVKDDGGLPDRAIVAARELVERNGVQLLFGNVGDAGVAALVKSGELRKWGVALLAPLSGVDVESDQVFFVRPTYRTEALRIVDWFRGMSLTRAAIVHGSGDFARESHEAVVSRLREVGVELVADVGIGGDGRDSTAVAARIAASRPQFVLVLADTLAAGQFVKAFRAIEPVVPVVGMSNIRHQTMLEVAGSKAAFGALLTQVVPDPFRGTSSLVREHLVLMKRFRDEPPSHATLEGFVAAKHLIATLRAINGEIDRASILTALRARREVDVGGFVISWPGRSNRGSRFADMTLLRKDGSLLQ